MRVPVVESRPQCTHMYKHILYVCSIQAGETGEIRLESTLYTFLREGNNPEGE